MNEIKIFEESMPDDIFTFNGSIIYKGHLINIFMDDYAQSWHIQYEKDGDLVRCLIRIPFLDQNKVQEVHGRFCGAALQ